MFFFFKLSFEVSRFEFIGVLKKGTRPFDMKGIMNQLSIKVN
jgi:hypothetical protein